MNKKEARIIALETFAENAELLIESDTVSAAIKSTEDCKLINEAFDELSESLRKKAEKLKMKRN